MIRAFAATLLFASLPLVAQTPPAITFEGNTVVARVTPGAETAWIWAKRGAVGSHVLRDDDGDGFVRWTGDVRAGHVWAVVDLANDAHAIAGAPGWPPEERVLQDGAILRGTTGAYSEFVIMDGEDEERQYLILRPGVGAWQLNVVLKPVFHASQFRPMGDAPPFEGVQPGDLLIALESYTNEYVAKRIDVAYLATGHATGVLHLPRSGWGNDKDGVRVPVIRVGGSDGTLALPYATSDGTAKSGVDYTATAGTLTFAPGEVLLYVDIATKPDGVYTAKELELSLRLGETTVPVHIADGERPPRIVVESKTVREGDSGVQSTTVAISIAGPTALTAVVPWRVSGNVSAPAQGTLRFEPGEVTKSITVDWMANDVANKRRQIQIEANPLEGQHVDPAFHGIGMVFIVDDDGPAKRRSAGR